MYNNEKLDIVDTETEVLENDESLTVEGIAETTDTSEILEVIPPEINAESLDEAKDMETIMDMLGLSNEEKSVYRSFSENGNAVENASGHVKLKGECPAATCCYTKVYYSCPYDKINKR